jgi:hypothetical protein
MPSVSESRGEEVILDRTQAVLIGHTCGYYVSFSDVYFQLQNK